MDAPTFQELERVGASEMMARNGALTLEVVNRDGSDANVLNGGGAAIADRVVGHNVAMAAELFLDSAQRTALDKLVFDRYGLRRKSAAAARTTAEFSTLTANPAVFSIPVDTPIGTNDGRVFVVTAAAVFPAGVTGPISVSVRSVLAGLSQQVGVGRLTSILSAISGAPSDLRVTNSLASAGADDEEDDPSLRERARRFFTTARRGTLAALEAAALAVPGVRRATATEAIDAFGRPAGVVELVVADTFTEQLVGTAPTPAAYVTQSQVLAAAVNAALYDVRAAGIYVRTRVAHVILLPVVLGLTFVAGADPDAAALAARSLVVSAINGLDPGEGFVVRDLVEVLKLLPELDPAGIVVLSPAGNVTVQTLSVLRTSLALVTVASLAPTFALQGNNPDAGA